MRVKRVRWRSRGLGEGEEGFAEDFGDGRVWEDDFAELLNGQTLLDGDAGAVDHLRRGVAEHMDAQDLAGTGRCRRVGG